MDNREYLIWYVCILIRINDPLLSKKICTRIITSASIFTQVKAANVKDWKIETEGNSKYDACQKNFFPVDEKYGQHYANIKKIR